MQEARSPLPPWALSQEAHSSDNAYYTSNSKTTLPFAITLGDLITLKLSSQKKALWSLSHCQLQSFGENFLFICIITNIPKARSQPKGASSGSTAQQFPLQPLQWPHAEHACSAHAGLLNQQGGRGHHSGNCLQSSGQLVISGKGHHHSPAMGCQKAPALIADARQPCPGWGGPAGLETQSVDLLCT